MTAQFNAMITLGMWSGADKSPLEISNFLQKFYTSSLCPSDVAVTIYLRFIPVHRGVLEYNLF